MIFIDKKFCTILVILSIFTIQCIELTIGEKPSSEHDVKPSVSKDFQKADEVQHNEALQDADANNPNGDHQEADIDGQTIAASINQKHGVHRSKKLSDKTIDDFDGKHVPDDGGSEIEKQHSNKSKVILPTQRKPEVISRDLFRPLIDPVAYGLKGLMKLVKKPFKKSKSKQMKPTTEENL
uniref:Uncharacterized protein n=1 Tax=Meloidogyne javanica TaxID=6303 RepID=A0A915ME24_MELJA